jgi:hypothetical protein
LRGNQATLMDIEILIPLRNITEVIQKTVHSLIAQTARDFRVVISDNFSTSGQEWIDWAVRELETSGVNVRRIKPPVELGRVEHWNWIHYESHATWLKPLFGGDSLEPDYIATVCAAVSEVPECAYVFCGYRYHHGNNSNDVISCFAGRYFSPSEMQDVVLRYAMQFGPPSAAFYKREIFLKSGAYEPSLPICADSLLFCKLAARNGAYGVRRVCVHFLIHSARFSNSLPEKKRANFRETLCYYADLGLTGWHEHWRFPVIGYIRMFLRVIRDRLMNR